MNQDKLQKLASLSNDGQLIILNEVEETKDTLGKKIDSLSEQHSEEMKSLHDKIDSIEIPEQKDHTKHMEKMMEMVNEPIEVEVSLNII